MSFSILPLCCTLSYPYVTYFFILTSNSCLTLSLFFQASFLNNQATIGNLRYVQTPWQHLPTRYGIVGGLVGAVVVLGIAIACICRCLTNRNKKGTEEGRRLVPQGRGPLRGVPRFLPFIPAGLRGKPNAGRAAVFEANRAIAPVRGTTWAAPAL